MRQISRLLGLTLLCLFPVPGIADDVDYSDEVKPLLREKCYSCHGAIKQEADLRLETRGLMIEGNAIVPGDPDSSELLARITSDGDDRMPPPDEGAELKPEQIRLLQRWIREGAAAPNETPPPAPTEHWAFQPIKAFEPPVESSATSEASTDHPIDVLLSAKWSTAGIDPAGQAERSLLIRRLYLDLVGLPPTRQQLRDERPYEDIVDELLASPAYGERWARHWMDVWRYSDWYGLGKQVRYSQKHIWRWRDWIIRSLNEDKGYDRMIQEMLAGDELAPDDPQTITGTGFLVRNYYLFNRTTWLDSTIEHTGKAFLGLTLNCAKCHDHKYDPISQLDYYRFRALLEPHQVRLDPIPGARDFEQDGLPRVFDDSVDRPTYLHVRGDPKNPDKDRPITPGFPTILASFAPAIEPVELPAAAYAPGTRDYVQQAAIKNDEAAIASAQKELKKATDRLRAIESAPPAKSSPEIDAFEITDTFDGPNPDVWEIVGDDWQYRDGALHQTEASREGHYARLVTDPPRDFEVECVYTTTGGTTYKSVSFRFDQSEDRKTENFVYSSAHAPGPKVHVAFTRNGSSSYPAEGRKATPIEVGRQYKLRFAVRDTLVNVWLDGRFIIAYRLPDRHDGFFSISGFDATVAFDEITIKTLASDVELTAAGNQPIASMADAKTAVKAAELKLAAMVARLSATEATIRADNVRFTASKSTNQQESESELDVSRLAARKQLEAKIADAAYRIVADATDATKRKAAENQKAAAEKSLAKLDTDTPAGTAEYESLRGSRKALESPAHKEADYPAVYPSVSTGRRLALAHWITSDKNPLTARVAVNQVWMRHFGTPLVESVFDFGLRAEKPLHAALLDALAAEFIANGWSFKQLHRRIVTSRAYRLSTSTRSTSQTARQIDAGNRYYWRFNSRRMESQLVRDSLLALGGKLDPAMGGPSIDPAPTIRRRSVYLKHSRDQQDKFLTMFDDADILQCYRRTESIVPQQALALSNSKLAIEMSNEIARQITKSLGSDSVDQFVNSAFLDLLCREPTDKERAECRAFFAAMEKLPKIVALDRSDASARMRSRFIQAILNHNDFVTIR